MVIVSVVAYQKRGFALGVSGVLMKSFHGRELNVLLKKTGSVEAMARILVIEDNPSNFKLFEMILKSSGYEVLWAKNGQEGLAFALEGQSALILLDVRLPVIDGFEVARRLKADERTARTPIVVVSAQAMQEDIQKAMALGVEGFITKPFRYKEILEAIGLFLGQGGNK